MSPTTTPHFILPDFFLHCPFPMRVNLNCHEQVRASEQWLLEVIDFNEEKRKTFEVLKGGKLAAFWFPEADPFHLRVCCDFINFIFVLDDLLDEFNVNGVSSMEQTCISVMNNVDCPQSNNKAAILIKSFFNRFAQTAPPSVKERFIHNMKLFFGAVTQQVSNRANDRIPNLETYISFRRDNSAAKPVLQMVEFAGGYSLPDEVLQHPLIKSLEEAANDHLSWTNDLFSYNKEQARGDKNNIVDVLMNERGLNLQDAVDVAGELANSCIDRFEQCRQQLPSWGPDVNPHVAKYIEALQDCIVGNLHWSFESERYFGKNGLDIKNRRIIELLPNTSA